MRLKFPDSYLVSWAFWSPMISMWIFLMAPVEPPHQLGAASKSIDCLGMRATILNGPEPTNVFGSVNHLSSPPPASIAFLLTAHEVQSATSVNQYAAGALSVAEKLKSSIFFRPVISVALPAATSS